MRAPLDERVGDIWDYHDEGWFIVVTTNGVVKRDGECVMGRGIALETKKRFPEFPKLLGDHLKERGNVVGVFQHHRILTLPVKAHWRDKADLTLIQHGVCDLYLQIRLATNPVCGRDIHVASVRPGCGNGQLSWDDVRPVVAPWFIQSGIVVVDRLS